MYEEDSVTFIHASIFRGIKVVYYHSGCCIVMVTIARPFHRPSCLYSAIGTENQLCLL